MSRSLGGPVPRDTRSTTSALGDVWLTRGGNIPHRRRRRKRHRTRMAFDPPHRGGYDRRMLAEALGTGLELVGGWLDCGRSVARRIGAQVVDPLARLAGLGPAPHAPTGDPPPADQPGGGEAAPQFQAEEAKYYLGPPRTPAARYAARHPVSGHGGALGRDRGRSRARERPRLGRDPARGRGARERRRGERGPLPLERRPRAADGALTPPAPRAMPPASLAFVLHAHLPFVRHPAHEDFLEERWLAEAITETYIPLLEVLGALERDRVPTRLTLSLSPPLLAMLADHLLRGRYLRHLDRLVELAEKEERRTRADERFHRVAEMYLARFCRARTIFLEDWGQDLIAAFRSYQERGLLEIITCAATHGFLPLLAVTPGAVRAQVEVAVAEHRRFFARSPEGFWLPECAYEPGLDAELARVGVRYFFVDTHGIAHATPRPVYGVYAPIACDSGVAAFGRDPDSSKQVWSAEEGYPGDFWYRDFYRDIGFDLDYDYVRPYLPPTGQRILTGLKYHRITGKTDVKAPYEPERARERLEAHAAHFVAGRVRQAAWLARAMDRPPLIVRPYDAELFGHWWFEGPWWLQAVLRRLAVTPELRAGTPGDDLARHPTVQRATPAASTWGWKGYNEVWLAGENDWLYRHLHATADRLHALCRSYPSADERTRRALTQALRELFLAQASDWAFMMSRATTVEYAVRRSLDHLLRCQELCAQVERGAVDDLRLAALEDTDNLFPTLDYRVFV